MFKSLKPDVVQSSRVKEVMEGFNGVSHFPKKVIDTKESVTKTFNEIQKTSESLLNAAGSATKGVNGLVSAGKHAATTATFPVASIVNAVLGVGNLALNGVQVYQLINLKKGVREMKNQLLGLESGVTKLSGSSLKTSLQIEALRQEINFYSKGLEETLNQAIDVTTALHKSVNQTKENTERLIENHCITAIYTELEQIIEICNRRQTTHNITDAPLMDAIYTKGEMHFTGAGDIVRENLFVAYDHFLRAADMGHAQAAYMVAHMIENYSQFTFLVRNGNYFTFNLLT